MWINLITLITIYFCHYLELITWSVAGLHSISNLTCNTVNNPSPPQLILKVPAEAILWQFCCSGARLHYFQFLFPLCCLPLPQSSRRECTLRTCSLPCKSLVLSIWAKTSGDTGFAQRERTENRTVLKGLTCYQLLSSLPYGRRLWWQHLKFLHKIV